MLDLCLLVLMFSPRDLAHGVENLGGRDIDLQFPAPSTELCAIVMLHLNPRPTYMSRATLGITSSCFSPSQTSATSFAYCQPFRTTMPCCVRLHRTAPLELAAAFPLPLLALL
jgi:hypothetical protein